jgi:CheY-like chemotaxis protein
VHTIIAGDDPIGLQVLCRILSRLGSVDVVPDCVVALGAVETALSWGAPPALVCFDVRVAGMSTRVAVREIRRLEGMLGLRGASPIRLLVTVSAREAARGPDSSSDAADGYVQRPVNERQLEQWVQSWRLEATTP